MGWPGMCPTPARRVTLLACICRNSAAALALTGLSEGCGAFLCTSPSVVIAVLMGGQTQEVFARNTEHGSFLSPCPMTFRPLDIPTGNIGCQTVATLRFRGPETGE